mmetsp:Transcript_21749/g.32854  ORF Transcript_21749/g.32854 Transcript_21749/m.32854 type:complete len:167 (+) Transcript_21749:110-610(+)
MSSTFFRNLCNCTPSLSEGITSAENDLLTAAKNGNLNQVRRLLRGGVDVNCVNSYGSTPLIMASIAGNLEIAEVLIEAGADVNQPQYQDWTALHGACFFGHVHLVCLLLMRGASTRVRTDQGKLPGEEFSADVEYAAGLEIQNILTKGLDALPEYRELLAQDQATR